MNEASPGSQQSVSAAVTKRQLEEGHGYLHFQRLGMTLSVNVMTVIPLI